MPALGQKAVCRRSKLSVCSIQKGGNTMKQFLMAALVLACWSTQAQIRTRGVPVRNAFTTLSTTSTSVKNITLFDRWIKGDPQRYSRLSVPMFSQRASHATRSSDTYWTGYMTTQSVRKGKLGTYYYWDVQGNLRESRTFFDINRKNKYSFKLVIPR
jgi:hypothetical protein